MNNLHIVANTNSNLVGMVVACWEPDSAPEMYQLPLVAWRIEYDSKDTNCTGPPISSPIFATVSELDEGNMPLGACEPFVCDRSTQVAYLPGYDPMPEAEAVNTVEKELRLRWQRKAEGVK